MTDLRRPLIDPIKESRPLNSFQFFKHFNPFNAFNKAAHPVDETKHSDFISSVFSYPNLNDSMRTYDRETTLACRYADDPHAAALMKVQHMNHEVRIWEMIALSEGPIRLNLNLRKLYEHVSALIKIIDEESNDHRGHEDRLGIPTPRGSMMSDISEDFDVAKRSPRRGSSRRGSRASIIRGMDRTIGT